MSDWGGFDDYHQRRAAEAASRRLDEVMARADRREAEKNKDKLPSRRQEKLKADIRKTLRHIRWQQEAEREQWLADYEERQRAQRELEMHAQELADEIRYAREQQCPNPWLKPGDSGYVSPELAEARRRAGDPDPYRRGA